MSKLTAVSHRIMSGISDQELQEIYDFAVQLGKDAGAMLMAAAQRRIQGDSQAGSSQVSYIEKESSVDLVTKADHGTTSYPKTATPSPRLG